MKITFPSSRINTTYMEESVIGNGSYGTVYKAKDLNNQGDYVAMKKVRIPVNMDGIPMSILREIGLVSQLERFQHPNIVRFLDVCHGPRQGNQLSFTLTLVFELLESDLAKYIAVTSKEELTPSKIKVIMFQVLCGVDFLHSHRIIHRDLKPQNILISRSGEVKLADFGLAKIYDFTMTLTTVVVTQWYRSPEVLLGTSYGSPLDMWSVGCIFAELWNKKAICRGHSERHQIAKIFDVIGTPTTEEWPNDSKVLLRTFTPRPCKNFDQIFPGIDLHGKELLQRMLVFNPHKRITAHDAIHNPFFEGMTIPPSDMSEFLDLNSVSLNKTPNTSTSPDDSGYTSNAL